MKRYLAILLCLAACTPEKTEAPKHAPVVSQPSEDTVRTSEPNVAVKPLVTANDTLTAIARLIAGQQDSAGLYRAISESNAYKTFSESFTKRWRVFDSTRIVKLQAFEQNALHDAVKPEKTLFYPFSGPDILHASLFFPDAERYILIALEPVGDLPDFEHSQADSLKKYFDRVNTSLNAILKFSFFRTESMSKDLKNQEVDGSVHLLFLFLSRLNNQIVSAKPITHDSTGNITYLNSFAELKAARLATKGIEIRFLNSRGQQRSLEYYSLNAVDYALKKNQGFLNYLNSIEHFNTYLKGASYLLHKDYFSLIRNKILEGSTSIVQDDSGIAYRYFAKQPGKWTFRLYGDYTRPVSLFAKQFQKDLDSVYRSQGSEPLGFGLGYNFKDKNSNLMVINRKSN